MQLEFVVMANDDSSVGVAEYDLCAHVDEFVDEEEAALEHLLVDEHCSLGLCGYNEHDAEEVRGESRPGGIGE